MRHAQVKRKSVIAGAAVALSLLALALSGPASAMVTPRLKPPAPGPDYLSQSDYAALKNVESAIDRRDWRAAHDAADAITGGTAKSLAQWLDLYGGDPTVDFSTVGAFLDAHKDWPALAKFQSDAEQRIPSDAAPQSIIDFFKTRDPLTGEGKLALAIAELKRGEKDAAVLHIRSAWINDNFRLADEQRLISHYGGYLTEEDHNARVDRLLWAREVTAARRVFSRLTPRDRRIAEARAALLAHAGNGPSLFNALPPADRLDPGVLLAAVRYFRRADDEAQAIEIAERAPNDPDALRNPLRWWEERQLLVRWALKEKRYADAYELAANNGLPPGGEFAEAEFDAGWIALRFLSAPDRAETHFRALKTAVGAPISLARAEYWLARAAEAEDRAALAGQRYAAAAQYIYTYYGQLAAERIGAPASKQTFDPPIIPTAEEKARFNARPLVAVMNMLTDLGDDRALLVFGYRLDDELSSPGEYVALADLVRRRGAVNISVRAGKVGIGRGAFAPGVAYPIVYVPDEATRFAPEELILGLSRQESEFNAHAYSSAGARGVMQLLPSTAYRTARREGLHYSRSALLDDPAYNMIIGSAHLSELMDRYDGSLVMALAAYNAGANNVDEWVSRYGDPRGADVDPVDWIEQIPFAETRNYVQRVFENTEIYRSRLKGAPIAGRLAVDLEAGGTSNRAGLLPGAQYADVLPALPARTLAFVQAGGAAASHVAPVSPALAAADENEVASTEEGAESGAAASDAGDADAEQDALSDADRADYIGDAKPRVEAPQAAPPAPAPKSSARAKKTKAAPAPVASMKAAAPAPASPSVALAQSIPAPAPSDASAESSVTLAGSNSAPAPNDAQAPASETKKDCATYRDYAEASATSDASSAADLNAAALARFSDTANDCVADGATPDSDAGPGAGD